VGFVVNKAALGAGFLRVPGFPLPLIPPIAPHPSLSIILRGWYNRPVVASVIVELCSTPPPPNNKRDYCIKRNYVQFIKYYCAEIMQLRSCVGVIRNSEEKLEGENKIVNHMGKYVNERIILKHIIKESCEV
jgi:hypothetical protein